MWVGKWGMRLLVYAVGYVRKTILGRGRTRTMTANANDTVTSPIENATATGTVEDEAPPSVPDFLAQAFPGRIVSRRAILSCRYGYARLMVRAALRNLSDRYPAATLPIRRVITSAPQTRISPIASAVTEVRPRMPPLQTATVADVLRGDVQWSGLQSDEVLVIDGGPTEDHLAVLITSEGNGLDAMAQCLTYNFRYPREIGGFQDHFSRWLDSYGGACDPAALLRFNREVDDVVDVLNRYILYRVKPTPGEDWSQAQRMLFEGLAKDRNIRLG